MWVGVYLYGGSEAGYGDIGRRTDGRATEASRRVWWSWVMVV